jgi:matrixin
VIPARPDIEPRRRRTPTWVLASGWVLVAALVCVAVFPRWEAAGRSSANDHLEGYGFTRVLGDGSPVRWNPCRAIHYVVNADIGPPEAAALVGEAVARVRRETGIEFIDEGTTRETPTQRFMTGLVRPGSGGRGTMWAPVLVSWATREEFGRLSGSPQAHGSAWAAPAPNDPRVYVTGVIAINADLMRDDAYPANFQTRRSVGLVLQHEFGHLVGLAHSSSIHEVMYPNPDDPGVVDWGPGDLAGLRRLGTAAGCLRTPPPR